MTETETASREQATALFDQFCEAFATFEATRIGEFFATPGVAWRSDGSLVGFAGRDDLLRYYQTVLDNYRANGCTSCRWIDLTVTKMGSRAMLATVTWELLRADDSLLTRWRQSYCLAMLDGAPKIFSSAMHAA